MEHRVAHHTKSKANSVANTPLKMYAVQKADSLIDIQRRVVLAQGGVSSMTVTNNSIEGIENLHRQIAEQKLMEIQQ